METASEPVPATVEDAYRALSPAMLRIAYLSVGSRAVAEEIVQDAFVQLARRFDEVENPGGYLRTVTVRACMRWKQRRATEASALRRVAEPGVLGAPELDAVWEALSKLRAERRTAIVLRYYEDLSYDDVAQLMRCEVATARTRVFRGLADLRKELGDA